MLLINTHHAHKLFLLRADNNVLLFIHIIFAVKLRFVKICFIYHKISIAIQAFHNLLNKYSLYIIGDFVYMIIPASGMTIIYKVTHARTYLLFDQTYFIPFKHVKVTFYN